MTIYTIPLKPLLWARAGRFGDRYYDRQAKIKSTVQAIISSQRPQREPWSIPLTVFFEFHMAIPKHTSKPVTKKLMDAPHAIRPDLDNLVKFLKDTLKGVLWVDDSIIFELHAKKFYSGKECTIIKVVPYDGYEVLGQLERTSNVSPNGDAAIPSRTLPILGAD